MVLALTTLAGPDWFILGGYFLLMLAIGVYFIRYIELHVRFLFGRQPDSVVAERRFFYMASFSAFSFVFYSSVAYMYGWVAITLFWVTIPATLVGVLFFAKCWRRARITSPVEYLETRYSPAVRQLFAWHGVLFRIVDDSLKLIAISMFLSVGLNIDAVSGILWAGLIIVAYTFMGGLWAVAVTDFVQFVVMAAAILILLPLSIVRAGGVSNILHRAPAGFFAWTSGSYDWRYVACNTLLFAICYSSLNWVMVQRYICVPTDARCRENRLAGRHTLSDRHSDHVFPSHCREDVSARSGRNCIRCQAGLPDDLRKKSFRSGYWG